MSIEELNELRSKEKTKLLETYEAIKEYYMGSTHITLSDKQEEIRRRWHAVYLKKLSRISDMDIAKNLQVEFGISQSQAYQDIYNSKKLFGIAGKSDRDLNRQIAERMSIETFQIAKERRNTRDMAAANRAFIESSGIKDDLSELPDFAKLEPSTYIVMLDPASESLLRKLLEKPTLNLSDLFNQIADDAVTE